jgi:hypothetical protein
MQQSGSVIFCAFDPEAWRKFLTLRPESPSLYGKPRKFAAGNFLGLEFFALQRK